MNHAGLQRGEQFGPRNRRGRSAKGGGRELRQIGRNRAHLQARKIRESGNAQLGVGAVAPAAGGADGHQAELVARTRQGHIPRDRGKIGIGQHGLGQAVIRHQVRLIQHLKIGEQSRSPSGGRDMDVDRAIRDTGQTFIALGARIGPRMMIAGPASRNMPTMNKRRLTNSNCMFSVIPSSADANSFGVWHKADRPQPTAMRQEGGIHRPQTVGQA